MTTKLNPGFPCGVALLFAAMAFPPQARGQTDVSPALPNIPRAVYAVTNYGAVGDGVTTNTDAIQAAISAASATSSGGTIEIPYVPGTSNIYLSGPIALKNKMNLQVDAGVTLRMLPYGQYPNLNPLVSAGSNPSDIEISGGGTIDGQATTSGWWNGMSTSSRPYLINLSHGTRIWIHDVTLTRPPKMHIVIGSSSSSDVTIERVTIATDSGDSHNTDGIDLTGHNELVRDCNISCGDDNIAITSTSYDILVTNCDFGAGHGMSFGSDTGPGGISNVTVINCTFNRTDNGIRIKSDNTSGGPVQDIHYVNLSMTNVNNAAIMIYGYYPSVSPNNASIATAASQPVTAITGNTPVWHDINFSNLTATVAGNASAGILWGRTEMPLTNIVLDDVHITAANTFNVFNAQQVQLIDSTITTTGFSQKNLTYWNGGIVISNRAPSATSFTFNGQAGNTNSSLALYHASGSMISGDAFGANPVTLSSGALTNTGNLTLSANDVASFALGTNNSAMAVLGNLNLNATLNITNAPGFTTTNYTLFTYTGNLSGQPVLGATPMGFAGYTYSLDTNAAGQVNLVVSAPTSPPAFGNIELINGSGGSFGLVMSGAGGAASGTYYVLASTNLALPLDQWTPVATNQFDAGGNFVFTNSAPANAPQQFFLLRLP
jgi:polygalacturonase